MRRSLATLPVVLGLTLSIAAATIPSGTKLRVRVTDDAETLARSFQFHVELVDDLVVAGKVVLPRGTLLLGDQTATIDATRIELVLIRRADRDYPIVTSSILVNATKRAQDNQRRQQGMDAAVDAVRGAIRGEPTAEPGSLPDSDAKALAPEQILQFKLRKKVDIDEESPPKKQIVAVASATK